MQLPTIAVRTVVVINLVLFAVFWALLPWSFTKALLSNPPTYMSLIALYLVGNLSASIDYLHSPTPHAGAGWHTLGTSVLLGLVLLFTVRATFFM